MNAWQDFLRIHRNCVDLSKLGKSAWDQELWKIQCVFRCMMRWCLATPRSPKYILSITKTKGRNVCIGYGIITSYRSKDPGCGGNGRVVWSLKEQSQTLGSINTPHRSVHLRYPSISVRHHRLPAAKLSSRSGEQRIFPPCHLNGPVQIEPIQSTTGSLRSSAVQLSCWTGFDWALSGTGIILSGGIFGCKEASSKESRISEEQSGSG